VYVQSFPGPGGKWQVSTAGGNEPHWSADGRQIYYRSADQKITAADITTAGAVQEVGVPKPLFSARFDTGVSRNRFLASADGQKFLIVAPLGREAMTPTTVVLNWAADLGK
jgi:hypothetical protein